jgi:hypothetical protein
MQTKADAIERKRAEAAGSWNFAGDNLNTSTQTETAEGPGGNNTNTNTNADINFTSRLGSSGLRANTAANANGSTRRTSRTSISSRRSAREMQQPLLQTEGTHNAEVVDDADANNDHDNYPDANNEENNDANNDEEASAARGPMSLVADAVGSIISGISNAIGFGSGRNSGSDNVQVAENVMGGSRMVRFNMDHTLLRGVRLQGQDRVLALVI